MIISHSSKFIFIHIQRTGGSTLINLLSKQLGENVKIVTQHGNTKSAELALILDNRDYFSFAFVRNPWDRILSWYLLINKQNLGSLEHEREKYQKFLEMDFAAVPGDIDFHYNQLDYISNDKGVILTNKLYRFENYEAEVGAMFKELNLPMIDIPKMNATWSRNYQDYYTERSKELIAEKCKKDIDYFGYKF